MDQPDQILGTFNIVDDDEGPQSGFITHFLDQDGTEAHCPDCAVYWAGVVTTGSMAGHQVRYEMDDDDQWTHSRVH